MKFHIPYGVRITLAFLSFPMLASLSIVSACSDDDDGDVPSPIVMLALPAGSFTMGDASGTSQPNERPTRTVTLNAFMMSKTEITQYQYNEIIGSNPSKAKGDNRPVEYVTWIQAAEFCNKLSVKEGRQPCYSGIPNAVACDFNANGYRLPTEAEWEYACRAGTTTPYYTGTTEADLNRASWHSGTAGGSTKDVAKLVPNDWGLYDMHGNVNELCWDWFDPDYYSLGVNDNPKGPTSGQEKICRGGAWFANPYSHRSAFRSMVKPGIPAYDIGIRIVRKQG